MLIRGYLSDIMNSSEHTDAFGGYRICSFPGGLPWVEPLRYVEYHRTTANEAQRMLNQAILEEYQRNPSLRGDELRAVVKHNLETKMKIAERAMELQENFFDYSSAIYEVFDNRDYGGPRTGTVSMPVPNLIPTVVPAMGTMPAEDSGDGPQINGADLANGSNGNDLN